MCTDPIGFNLDDELTNTVTVLSPALTPYHVQGQPQLAVSLNGEDPAFNLDRSSQLGRILPCHFLCLCNPAHFPLNLLILTILEDQTRIIISGKESVCFYFKWFQQNEEVQGQTTPMAIGHTNYHWFYLHSLINEIISIVYSKLPNERNNGRVIFD